MIFESTLNFVSFSDEAEQLLEDVQVRENLELYTMTDISHTLLFEHEQNWNNFMKNVGLDELSSIHEGQTVIYEGGRLSKFLDKAKEFFKKAIAKLAELTKSFIVKINQFFRTNKSFVKKYEDELKSYSVSSDFKFKGYEFRNTENTKYASIKTNPKFSSNDTGSKKEMAEKDFVGNISGDSFSDKIAKFFYGDGGKEKKDMNNPDLKKQLEILKETKSLKSKANRSYTAAAGEIHKIIGNLKDDKKNEEDSKKAKEIENALEYWKAYSTCALQFHGSYLMMLGTRSRQAKAICAKAMIDKIKRKNKKESTNESFEDDYDGYYNTESFLDSVDFL